MLADEHEVLRCAAASGPPGRGLATAQERLGAGPALDSGLVDSGSAVMAEAIPDLRMIEADNIKEGDKVAFRWLLSGTHAGEFMGVTATGKRVEAMGMDIVRLANGEIAEHWGEFDVMGLLRQIGVIPQLEDSS
jgi:hypothetical protein